MLTRGRAPLPVSRDLDPGALCRANPCDVLCILGSFWPYSHSSFDSRVVKAFKECAPVADFQPHICELCEFFAGEVLKAAEGESFDWVIGVLGSSETEVDPARPQSLLIDTIAKRTKARGAEHVFFRSGPRPPMRTVKHLSGPEALRTRITYAAQDLFVRPTDLGGTALLIDDIMNTGASVRLYADTLKRHCGVERVICVNLAVTRFGRGRDGWGTLRIDTSALNGELAAVWVDPNGFFHVARDCGGDGSKRSVELRFLAEKSGRPCSACVGAGCEERKWWQVWRRM